MVWLFAGLLVLNYATNVLVSTRINKHVDAIILKIGL